MVRLRPSDELALDTCGPAATARARSTSARPSPSLSPGPGSVVKHGTAPYQPGGRCDVLTALGVGSRRARVGATHARRMRLRLLLRPAFHLASRRSLPCAQARSEDDLQPARPAAEPGRAEHQLLGGRSCPSGLWRGPGPLGTRQAFLVCGRDGLDESVWPPYDGSEGHGRRVGAWNGRPRTSA